MGAGIRLISCPQCGRLATPVSVATRSATLVAASLAHLIRVMVSCNGRL
jgi:hypothetical protein